MHIWIITLTTAITAITLVFYMHYCLFNLYAFPNEAQLYVTSNLSLLWNSYFMPLCTSQLNINDSVWQLQWGNYVKVIQSVHWRHSFILVFRGIGSPKYVANDWLDKSHNAWHSWDMYNLDVVPVLYCTYTPPPPPSCSTIKVLRTCHLLLIHVHQTEKDDVAARGSDYCVVRKCRE